METMKLTRKIQLLIDLPTKEERKEALDTLYGWQNRCFRAANLIVSHLYVQEMIKEFLYLSEGVRYKLADQKKDELGILNRSGINTTYRLVSDRFKGEMPTNILSCLNMALHSTFKKERDAYWKGERSLKNFLRDMPFPFSMEGVSKIVYDTDKKAFCFRLFGIPLKTYLGKDFTDKKKLLEQVVEGKTSIYTSHLQLKDGKVFWLAVFGIEKENNNVKPEVIAEASLSLEYPITVKVGRNRKTIGTQEEFLYRRLAIQSARKRAQSGAKYSKPGKGRKGKLKAVKKFERKERDYVKYRMHVYIRELINFCVHHQAGTLLLLDQKEKEGIAKDKEFVLRNWSYYSLLEKIQYKAKKAGIEVLV